MPRRKKYRGEPDDLPPDGTPEYHAWEAEQKLAGRDAHFERNWAINAYFNILQNQYTGRCKVCSSSRGRESMTAVGPFLCCRGCAKSGRALVADLRRFRK